MIIWSGFGFVVPVILFTCLLVTQFAVDGIMGQGYYSEHSWTILIASAVAAVAIWFCGKWLNKPTGKVLVDKETGQEIEVKPNHSFFFIPVQTWAFIAIGIGVVMVFT